MLSKAKLLNLNYFKIINNSHHTTKSLNLFHFSNEKFNVLKELSASSNFYNKFINTSSKFDCTFKYGSSLPVSMQILYKNLILRSFISSPCKIYNSKTANSTNLDNSLIRNNFLPQINSYYHKKSLTSIYFSQFQTFRTHNSSIYLQNKNKKHNHCYSSSYHLISSDSTNDLNNFKKEPKDNSLKTNARKLHWKAFANALTSKPFNRINLRKIKKLNFFNKTKINTSIHLQQLYNRGKDFTSIFHFRKYKIFTDRKQISKHYKQKIFEKSKLAKHSFKALWKKYGYVGVVTYLGVYISSLTLLFVCISNGLFNGDDLTAFIEKYELNRFFDIKHIEKVDTIQGRFIIAWIACKIIEPARFVVTLTLLPWIAKAWWKYKGRL